jgi:hypothetical protein
MNLKQARMIKFDKKSQECKLVPLICTCTFCLLGNFEECEFALFKNLILKKKLRENSEQISQPQPEAAENDHFFDYPVEYDYENLLNQTLGSQLSSSRKTLSENGHFDEYSVETDYEHSINQSPRSQPSNSNDSLSELSSSEFIIPLPNFGDEAGSEDDIEHHHLDVDLTAREAANFLKTKWRTDQDTIAFNRNENYYTDTVNDFYRMMDEKCKETNRESEIRFVELYKFWNYTKLGS